MRIDSLKVQNFRCFEQAKFQFSPRFNLLVGVNGSGKTSLLNAVAAVLAMALKQLAKAPVWFDESQENVRLALMEVNKRVRYDRCYPAELWVAAEVLERQAIWSVSVDGSGVRYEGGSAVWDSLTILASNLSKGAMDALPIVAYYKAERYWKLKGVAPSEAVKKLDSRMDGYAFWHDAVADMQGFEEWIVGKSLERLEAGFYHEQDQENQVLDELSLVSQAVAMALPGAKGVRFDIKYRRLVLDWDDKPPTPFDILSDGQRGLTTLVADIARRMCLLNPQLGNGVLSQTPGIVVIDELDIHLHPAWQRRVVPMLKQTFPKVQFFAASHSPQIIGELPAEEIILLQDGQAVGHPEYSLGLDSAEILEALMDSPARNTKVAEKLHAIRQAIDDDDLELAQSLLDALESEVGAIPEVLGNRSAINSLRLLEDDGQ